MYWWTVFLSRLNLTDDGADAMLQLPPLSFGKSMPVGLAVMADVDDGCAVSS